VTNDRSRGPCRSRALRASGRSGCRSDRLWHTATDLDALPQPAL